MPPYLPRSMQTPSTHSSVEFAVVNDLETFLLLQNEWENLWHAVRGNPFQSFLYCLHALREVAIPARANPHCIVGRKADRIVFVWPLIRYREYFWHTVRPLTHDVPEPSHLLVAHGEDAESLIQAAWRTLLSSSSSDVVNLPMLRTDSALYRFVLQSRWLSQGEWRVVGNAPLLQFGTWAHFRANLAESFRKRLDYDQRRLHRAGEASIFIPELNDPRSLACVDTMLEWKREWSARAGVTGDFFKTSYQKFLREILTDPSLNQYFRLFVLSLNGKPIAMNLIALAERAVIGMQSAYDPTQAKWSPGSVLQEYVLKWAFENRRDLDFGPGDSKYKLNWTGGLGYTCADIRIATSHWGRSAFAALTLQRWYERFRRLIAEGPLARLRRSGS
jgi:CelD/BcsL family acetyltransferase involved in cellulose biosynthesis